MQPDTVRFPRRRLPWLAGLVALAYIVSPSQTQPPKGDRGKTSYDQIAPTLLGEQSFADMMAKDKAAKAGIMAKHMAFLKERYDLAAKTDPKVKMTRGKAIPVGPATRLPDGMTWDQLAAMSSEEIRDKGLFPKGFLPLPHPNHPAGGMV